MTTLETDDPAEIAGNIALVLGPFSPWPPPSCTLVYQSRLGTALFTIWGTPALQLVVTLKPENGRCSYTTTCPIEYRGNAPFVFICTFSGESLNVRINGKLVGCSQRSDVLAEEITVGISWVTAGIDLSSRNKEVRVLRRNTEGNRKPKINRRLLSSSETRRMLILARDLLCDSLLMLESGKIHFYISIATTLRALVCSPLRQNELGYPLLQRAAGLLDLPLNVYATHVQKEFPTNIASIQFYHGISIEPQHSSYTEMDVDIWLTGVGAVCNGRTYSNNHVIRAIANTQGSHFDPDVEPLVEILDDILIMGRHSAIVRFLLDTGRAVHSLCVDVIESWP